MPQYVVMQGLSFDSPKKDIKEVNKFFKEQGWGQMTYVLQFKTLPGFGGPGGRNDVVFRWSGNQQELGKFSVMRLAWGADAPRWLEDYIDNNKPIIPNQILKKLEEIREW
jgi:hypothetical protein